jgi:hypothetical protein
MKKILKGSVVISAGGDKFWVIEHKKGFIKVLNEAGKEQYVSEATASTGAIMDGSDAMDIIREVWY